MILARKRCVYGICSKSVSKKNGDFEEWEKIEEVWGEHMVGKRKNLHLIQM